MLEALGTWNMGRVIAAYRHHPYHGRPLPQEVVAGWAGLTQAHLSRIENGPPIRDIVKLGRWARTLGIPAHLLWFKLPEGRPVGQANDPTPIPTPKEDRELAYAPGGRHELLEIDDMNRRELLRLMTMAGTLTAAAELGDGLDSERLGHFAEGGHPLDSATVDQYATLNSYLWRVFALSRTKSSTYPLVREQLAVLVQALQRPQETTIRQRLCALASDLFQLAGEILFDGNHYTDAAHCYTLAATAGREAGAHDLWACALTRHAFIEVYEHHFAQATPMLDLAARVARKGDPSLSTRQWVSAVQAEAFAGLGDIGACERALDRAEQVRELDGNAHNGGWLRFDGSRLAEERGTCYVALQRPDLAEDALSDALSGDLSTRRRGCVLTDLAMLGVMRRDLGQLVTYATAALEIARQTGSGVIGRKLRSVEPFLTPFLADRRVHRISAEINALPRASA